MLFGSSVCTLSTLTVSAQNDIDLTNAILNNRNGLYDKAKSDIDIAILKEKVNAKPKGHYNRGLIYQNCLLSPLPNMKKAVGDSGALVAYHSFKRAIELDKPDGEYSKPAKEQMVNIYALLVNEGGSQYNAKNLTGAYKNFTTAADIKPKDTLSSQNALYVAVDLKDAALVQESFVKVQKAGTPSINIYRVMLDFYGTQKMTKEQQETLAAARKAYPNDKNFINQELNNASTSGQSGVLKKKLQDAAIADPKSATYPLLLGNLYMQEANKITETVNNKATDKATKAAEKKRLVLNQDSAIGMFKTSLALDSSQFDPSYNIGVIYYNRAKEVADSANLLPLDAPKAKKDKLDKKAEGLLSQAVPYFERCSRLNPKDESTFDVLERLYARLRNDAMLKKTTQRREALKK